MSLIFGIIALKGSINIDTVKKLMRYASLIYVERQGIIKELCVYSMTRKFVL